MWDVWGEFSNSPIFVFPLFPPFPLLSQPINFVDRAVLNYPAAIAPPQAEATAEINAVKKSHQAAIAAAFWVC